MIEPPVLGVIGGSGVYNFANLEDPESVDVHTPFGMPSSPVIIGTLAGKRVAFLARHGIGHHISPSEVNYRANIYAFKALGVKRIVSISACGSLRDDYAPGHIVIPDQVFDFTKSRVNTFFSNGLVSHIGTAEPYCSSLSSKVYQSVKDCGASVHAGGTYITIEGPRFSTKGESNIFRAWGMAIIGMTACPEVFLAREAEICYSTMAHVTDYDVWHTNEEPVTVEMVVRTLQKNTVVAQQALEKLVANLDGDEVCTCHSALESSLITHHERVPAEIKRKLAIFVDKYIP